MRPTPPLAPEAPHSPEPTLPPAARRRRARAAARTRQLTLALAAAALTAVAFTLAGDGAPPLPRQIALALAVAAGALALGALLARLRRLWDDGLRAALQRLGDRLARISMALWPGSSGQEDPPTTPPLRGGERVALVAGLALTALDVVLTTLLLRDVFPEPPYRLDLLDALAPAAGEWAFYVAIAAFKALLELWLGVVDRLRARAGGEARPLRFFVLGLASAFDAALAIARGLLLAEQGLTGATVLVSNIVFVGFGVAVPWVVAHTGGLLVDAADPLLARFGLLRALGALPRLVALVALWGAAFALGAPIVAAVIAVGALMVLWSALDDLLVTLLGHDDPDAPDLAPDLAPAPAPAPPEPDPSGALERSLLAGGGR